MSSSWHKNAVALTGTIGSGKSTVAQIFKDLGAFTASADEFARAAVAPGTVGLAEVVQEFGADILLPDCSLDRKKLAGVVFSDPIRRKRLEEITHPHIRALAKAAFEDALTKNYPLLVYECPLLFEAGLDRYGFSKIILVTASPDQCIRRIMDRDGISDEEAKKRLASQYSVEEKLRRSDLVIENNGTISELKDRVAKLFAALQRT